MAWLIGLKPVSGAPTGTIIELSNCTPDFTLASLRTIFPSKYGGTSADYTFYKLSAAQLSAIDNGSEYTTIWTSAGISAVNFSVETSKRWMKLSADTDTIINDGIDSVTVSFQAWVPSLSGIATNVTVTNFRVPVITPSGDRYVRINMTSGVGSATFKTTIPGRYTIPGASKRFGNLRVFNQLNIDVDDDVLLS